MFPLWVRGQPQGDGFFPDEPNIRPDILERYDEIAGAEATPFRVHMYIYAVMYSIAFRTVFDENIKEDFIRIPFPTGAESFAELSAHGEALFRLHTLSDPALDQFVTSFPEEGSNKITRPIGKDDWEADDDRGTVRVWINDEQYFDGIPVEAWEMTVGGYFPAQRWLKDRRGTELPFHEVETYQRIIVALSETARIMGDIDEAMAGLFQNLGQ
jgi:predicted helicase